MVKILEIIAVIFSLIYLMLLIKEKIACWFFGISSSIISIYIFYSIGLYSESLLYFYYIIVGIYGYQLWKKSSNKKEALKVSTIGIKKHLLIVLIGIITSVILGYFFDQNTNAINPYLDASTTIFSFIASFLEAKKILSAWVFWLFINAATVVLYFQQNLSYYLALTILYFLFSIVGYIRWKKSYEIQKRFYKP
ncbi:MAG: nicotinamide riboside transporter PnuC [Polaribacter sp.]